MNKMQSIPMARSQQGFTIIELVVVILLLGILTATALPRFLDLNTEAHDAVIDGVEGGLRTGVALFRAQYIASGSPGGGTQLNDFGGVRANAAGYPGGEGENDGTASGNPDGTFDETDAAAAHGSCANIYRGLLQGGAPIVVAAGDDNMGPYDQTEDIDDALGGSNPANADFLAKLTASDTCTFLYIGDSERTDLANDDIPALRYEATAAGASGEAGAITVLVL